MPIPEGQGVAQRALLRDHVLSRLTSAIVEGRLAPGERLRDTELERWLGVSRTPIREALARLEQAGLVQTQPGRQTRVAPLDMALAQDAQSVVRAMHVLAVKGAVPKVSEHDILRMRQANDVFATSLRAGDVEGALAADDDFHAVPVAVTNNRAAAAVLEQYTPLLRRVERLRFSTLSGRGSVAQHERLVIAFEAGDVDAAVSAVDENWQTLSTLLGGPAEPDGMFPRDDTTGRPPRAATTHRKRETS